MSITTTFGLTGLIIVLGFVGNYLFKKTGIPDIVILLFLGLLIGPISHKIDPSVFFSVSQVFSALALMILLFEGGLNLNLYKVIQESPRATLLATLGILTSMGFTAIFTFYLWNWNILSGLLLGAMIGGSSSSIVIPLIRKIKVNEKIISLLSLESAFTDAITVVIGITILQLMTSTTNMGVSSVSHSIASAFSIGAMMSLIIGIVWLRILKSIEKEPYKNILTLAVVFILYAVIESLGGNGAISSLIFGLVLGNSSEISKIFRMKDHVTVTKIQKEFHSEISFLIRTFFFVYLGMIVTITNYILVLISVVLSGLLLVGRFISVSLSSFNDKTLQNYKGIMTIMLPRGLAAAVLSQLPLVYGIANARMYPDIIFTVIMSTVLICTVGVFIVSKRNLEQKTR